MSEDPFVLRHKVICIVGPTATGKSELAQRVAERIDGEIISADSMQIYRGMDIGTGKVAPDEQRVKHHGLDIVEPGEPYSAALFQEYARSKFYQIDGENKRIVLCGGTGFYIRAALFDYDFPEGEQLGNEIRDAYLAYQREHGTQALWDKLYETDPASAKLIAPNDIKRVVRAFELLESKTTYAAQKEKLAHIPLLYPHISVGLSIDPDILRARIDRRVDAMFDSGLVEEVEALLEQGYRSAVTANQAIGYKEIVEALDGDITLDEAREKIKIGTHRYAKRQRTWFRKDAGIHWIDGNDADMDRISTEALVYIQSVEE